LAALFAVASTGLAIVCSLAGRIDLGMDGRGAPSSNHTPQTAQVYLSPAT
jgi:hypothetical protein